MQGGMDAVKGCILYRNSAIIIKVLTIYKAQIACLKTQDLSQDCPLFAL